jgi:hypothetical protein
MHGSAKGETPSSSIVQLFMKISMREEVQGGCRYDIDVGLTCKRPWWVAEEVREMRAREKRDGTEVDWAVEAFMKAAALEGRRESMATDLALRLLDLEVGPRRSLLARLRFPLLGHLRAFPPCPPAAFTS